MNWRKIKPGPYSLWHAVISDAGGPDDLASREAWAAAGDLSGLALCQLRQESLFGTSFKANPVTNHNALNLRPRGGLPGFQHFDSWVDGIAEYRARLTDPTYAYAHTTTLEDLIHVFAPSSDGNNERTYAAGIVNDLDLWGLTLPEETPMTNIVFGNVPYPPVIQSHLPASNPMIKTSGAPAVPDAVVYHRMIGTFRGTDGWFHQGHAATAYGIGVAATDAASDDGRIFEWIAPRSGWYGESSGPVSKPYGDGLALVNKVGINSVNRVSTAIEISGNYDTPLDDKARDAIAALTAYWADQKHIPWNEFPKVPGEDRSFVVWHQELTIGTGKVCPGEVVMNETPALIERTKAVLKKYQTSTAAPVFAEKQPVPAPLHSKTINGMPFVRGVGSLILAEDTTPRQFATEQSAAVARDYKAGRKITPQYVTIGGDGDLWIVEGGGRPGARLPYKAFKEGR